MLKSDLILQILVNDPNLVIILWGFNSKNMIDSKKENISISFGVFEGQLLFCKRKACLLER